MNIECNIVDQLNQIYEVVTILDGNRKLQGYIQWDPFQGERCEWIAEPLLIKCLEIFVSDERMRKGYLGDNLKKAQHIAMQVAGAWETIAFEGTRNANLQVPKLDLDTDSLLVLFPSNRPLTRLNEQYVA